MMAGNRRYQQEVDRTLKRIYDGCAVFSEMWERIEAIPFMARPLNL
jgi:hypothetical protein